MAKHARALFAGGKGEIVERHYVQYRRLDGGREVVGKTVEGWSPRDVARALRRRNRNIEIVATKKIGG
jgi:hypothetical protein